MSVWVVVRARNDMPLVASTLEMLARQTVAARILVMDNGSTDGTRELAERSAERVLHVERYVPGAVLNEAMRMVDGEIVAFLNSDCTPLDDTWLENLIAGFYGGSRGGRRTLPLDQPMDDRVAAVFGRQVARPDCQSLFVKDTDDTYGDGARQKYWRHCFSMAASAIRRSVWEHMPFDETLHYSEDIAWTWNARRHGLEIRYVPDAVVAHSHNYSLAQWFRRQRGEGQADAHIFDWSPWQRNFLRYAILPFTRQVVSDLRWCAARGNISAALYSPVLRAVGVAGRWAGFSEGLREVTCHGLRAVCQQ